MRALEKREVESISGATFDWKGVPIGVAMGIAASSLKWAEGAEFTSAISLMWGTAGFLLGSTVYYSIRAVQALRPEISEEGTQIS